MGECRRQRCHQSRPATYSQRRSNPRKVLQPPGQVYQTREQATAQGGAQALPQLQQQYLHPPKRPRHRWDQDVARLCPLLYARQSSSPTPGVSLHQEVRKAQIHHQDKETHRLVRSRSPRHITLVSAFLFAACTTC